MRWGVNLDLEKLAHKLGREYVQNSDIAVEQRVQAIEDFTVGYLTAYKAQISLQLLHKLQDVVKEAEDVAKDNMEYYSCHMIEKISKVLQELSDTLNTSK